MSFVHLHTHSDYSCLQSLASVAKLLERCVAYQLPGIALTDIGNMYGAIEFFDKAQKYKGINPIIGCEFYVGGEYFKETPETTIITQVGKHKVRAFNRAMHMPYGIFKVVLLAETLAGYKNLIRLNTLAYENFVGIGKFPVLRLETLYKHKAGLICLSGGSGSELFDLIARKHYKQAYQLAEQFLTIFGREHYFLEIQDHANDVYSDVTTNTIELSGKLHAQLVACNEVYYLNKEDWYTHEIMLCIASNQLISSKKGSRLEDRPSLVGTGYHFKSVPELEQSFAKVPEALQNTLRINARCRVNIHDKVFHMPKFALPEGTDANTTLKNEVTTRLKILFKNKEEIPEIYWDRMHDELEVIHSMGFSEYFLIVADLVDAAKQKAILVGPGRGSVVGSLVAYALGITDVDPFDYELLFERFLIKERVSMPDIDIDFQDDRRDEIIEYLKEKYGTENTCQIITYARLKPRAVIKDVCRVFNVDFQLSNRLSALIPDRALPEVPDQKITLELVYERINEFREQIRANELLRHVYQHSLKLQNLIRQTGIHAAGVVIADKPLDQYIPLVKNEEDIVVSQYDGQYLETHCGLLKMDILGLRTLSLIKNALEQIAVHEKQTLNWRDFPLNDKKTLACFAKGMTMGVFQFESEGMTRYLRELKPTNLDELIAMNALFRPGPMAWIPVYIAKKHQRTPKFQSVQDQQRYEKLEELCSRFPALKQILASTRLLPVFQEQIMQLCRIFAGFSLAEADKIRQAMGKKKKNLIDALRREFINGAKNLGHKEQDAMFLYDEITEPFGGYGFNKSHAAGYAVLAYRVAYIKVHYPAYFMAAFLNSEIQSLRPAKMRRIFQECELNHITILPPDISTSTCYFQNTRGTISFAFNAIKGISRYVADNIVTARKEGAFLSLSNFLRRMGKLAEARSDEPMRGALTKQVLEALIKAQCFDSLYQAPATPHKETKTETDLLTGLRADTLLTLYPAVERVISAEINMFRGGQQSLFAVTSAAAAAPAGEKTAADDKFAIERPIFKKLNMASGAAGDKETLKNMEQTSLGFNFREDATLKYLRVFKECTSFNVTDPSSWQEGEKITLAGLLEDIQVRYTKKNNEEMGILKVNNGLHIFEAVCFPATWKRIKNAAAAPPPPPRSRPTAPSSVELLVLDNPLKIEGFFKKSYGRNESLSIIVNNILPLREGERHRVQKTIERNKPLAAAPPQQLYITLNHDITTADLTILKENLHQAPHGTQKVYLILPATTRLSESTPQRTLFLGDQLKIQFTETLRTTLSHLKSVRAVVTT